MRRLASQTEPALDPGRDPTTTRSPTGRPAPGISAGLSPELCKVGAALVLSAPFTPMLFPGEEWAASTAWQFFTDHREPELAAAVREGRRREFAEHGWAEEEVPDPQDSATFRRSTLDWDELSREPHAGVLAFYRDLLRLRRRVPDLTDPRLDRVAVAYDDRVGWLVVTRGSCRVAVNLTDGKLDVQLDVPVRELLLASGEAEPVDRLVRLAGQLVAVVR